MSDAILSASPVIGDASFLAYSQVVGANIACSPVIGDASFLVDPQVARARIACSPAIGDASVLVAAPSGINLSATPVIGDFTSLIRNDSDEWGSADFGCPLLSVYSYTRQAALRRTPMMQGNVRQRRLWTGGLRTATLRFRVQRNQLFYVEQFLAEKNYGWFNARLITGDGGATPQPIPIRFTGRPQLELASGDWCTFSVQAEIDERLV